MELQNRLHNIKKGSSTTKEYITPIKSNAEILEEDGQPIDQASLTYALIWGLEPQYISFVIGLNPQ